MIHTPCTLRTGSPRTVLCTLLVLALALPSLALAADGEPTAKRDPVASRLILPYYEVDTQDASGLSTLFAVRNESSLETEILISFYEPDAPQAPQYTIGPRVLTPKEIITYNIRNEDDHLEVDPDGFARGYVVIETTGGESRISGDYIFLTPGEDFATSSQLVNGTPGSVLNELCSIFSVRWFRGPFDAESVITIWLDTDTVPVDPEVITYTVYDDSGTAVITNNLPIDVVSLRVTVDELLGGFDTGGGAVELQISNDILGHVAVSIDAFGRFSAGFEAFCRD